MALSILRIRRAAVNFGANSEQADDFAEAFSGFVTISDLERALREQEMRIVNRMLIAMFGFSGLIIAAVALLVKL